MALRQALAHDTVQLPTVVQTVMNVFGSIKVEEFPELMSNYCLLCKDLFHVSSVRGTEQAGHSQGFAKCQRQTC